MLLSRHADLNSLKHYYHATTARLEEIVNRRGRTGKQNGGRTAISGGDDD